MTKAEKIIAEAGLFVFIRVHSWFLPNPNANPRRSIDMTAIKTQRILMGKLAHGSDLVESLNGVCRREGIVLGRVEALGAVQRARVGYYNQETRTYEFHELNQPMEIASLVGNVSLKDGQAFVHAHVTLTDREGRARGGHLAPGAIVFACEYIIHAFEGPAFERGYDDETGLPLWTTVPGEPQG
jgi:predicted DNA-binding protein with PD1-like motif